MVGILAQAVDAAVGTERELVLGKQLRATSQCREQAADLVQAARGDAALFDAASLVDQAPHGGGTLMMQVHLILR